MSWEDVTLNEYLRGHDLSDASEAAIDALASAMMADDGPKGFHPNGDYVALLFNERYTAGDVLSLVRQYLMEGDFEAVGRTIQSVLDAIAQEEAETEARIQVDHLLNEPTAAQEAAYDDRLRGDY